MFAAATDWGALRQGHRVQGTLQRPSPAAAVLLNVMNTPVHVCGAHHDQLCSGGRYAMWSSCWPLTCGRGQMQKHALTRSDEQLQHAALRSFVQRWLCGQWRAHDPHVVGGACGAQRSQS